MQISEGRDCIPQADFQSASVIRRASDYVAFTLTLNSSRDSPGHMVE